MPKITVTEALAELPTLKKRITKLRVEIGNYSSRPAKERDPHYKIEGGSRGWIERQLQSVRDMETRYLRIRQSIQRSNLDSMLSVEGVERPVMEWLNWRNEIAKEQGMMPQALLNAIQRQRKAATAAGGKLGTEKEAQGDNDIIVNVHESDLIDQVQKHETIMGALDGKLSLHNATTMIELPD